MKLRSLNWLEAFSSLKFLELEWIASLFILEFPLALAPNLIWSIWSGLKLPFSGSPKVPPRILSEKPYLVLKPPRRLSWSVWKAAISSLSCSSPKHRGSTDSHLSGKTNRPNHQQFPRSTQVPGVMVEVKQFPINQACLPYLTIFQFRNCLIIFEGQGSVEVPETNR